MSDAGNYGHNGVGSRRVVGGVQFGVVEGGQAGSVGVGVRGHDHGRAAATQAPSTPPPAASGQPTSSPPGGQTAPPSSGGQSAQAKSTAGAIQRYEQFLHALGQEDIDTVCEIAGPAAKRAQDQGFGPCKTTFAMTFQMISPAQKKALQAATVDPKLVVVRSPDKIEMPVKAVKATTTFSESNLGSYTLEYMNNAWYITD